MLLENLSITGGDFMEEEFTPRKPDYKGEGVVAWLNKKGSQEWLTIQIEGEEKKLVAFKNE